MRFFLEPAFVDSGGKRIFVLLRGSKSSRRCVLMVPPFAEEMNKCRRQFTESALILVEQGLAVVTVDLFGTGDSEGEFSEATWSQWCDDIEAACLWAEGKCLVVDSVIACRMGCTLVAESLVNNDRHVSRSVFWQPVVNGRQAMTHFLRLRVAAAMMENEAKESVPALRERLLRGNTLEVAGYELSPSLWGSIEASNLEAHLTARLGTLIMLEIGGSVDASLSVAGQRLVEAVDSAGIDSSAHRIPGEPFWVSTEIVVNSELIGLTVQFLTGDVVK